MKAYSLMKCGGGLYDIINYVTDCMKKENLSDREISSYRLEATSSEYWDVVNLSNTMLLKLNEGKSDG